MKRRTLVVGLSMLVASALLIGCGHAQFMGALDRGRPTPATGRGEIPMFTYDRTPPEISMELKKETDQYRLYFVKIRKTDFEGLKNQKARAFYFEQKDTSKKTPALICLPPTGGPIELASTFAEAYAQKGYNTLAFYRREQFFNPSKPIEYNVTLFRQSVIDVRRGIDFLETREVVDTDRVAILGMSLGGILGSLATEADSRIKATAMLVSSGSLAHIMETSQYGRVIRFRKGMIKRYGFATRQELIDFAGPKMGPVDPITYADRIDPARVLMINGYQDNIIKISAARQTWEAFGRPTWRTLPVGHYSAFALISLAKKWTLAHFESILGPAA